MLLVVVAVERVLLGGARGRQASSNSGEVLWGTDGVVVGIVGVVVVRVALEEGGRGIVLVGLVVVAVSIFLVRQIVRVLREKLVGAGMK